MRIEVFGDGIDRSSIPQCPVKVSCRGIIVKNQNILVVHFLKLNLYNIPGGGIELHESYEQCVEREVREETGYVVKVDEPTVTIVEYYPDSIWETHYYRCHLLNDQPLVLDLTQEEIAAKANAEWIEQFTLLDLLESTVSTHPNATNIHNRELLGLLNSL